MNGAISVLFPSYNPPESTSIEVPESMNGDDRELLLRELGKISAEVAKGTVRLDTGEARLKKLEAKADASGRHDVDVLQKALAKADERTTTALEAADAAKRELRARLWSIGITFFTTSVIALVGYYLTHR